MCECTVSIMLSATLSFGLPPLPFQNSALARISHLVASLRLLMGKSGVEPTQVSSPSPICSGFWPAVALLP